MSTDTVSAEEQAGAAKAIEEWSTKFESNIDDAITKCITDAGVSPITREELVKHGANILFGAAVVVARTNGLSVRELQALIQVIEDARTVEGDEAG